MRKELDELLCKRYPKIFVQRNLPMNQTCMCWGFSCDDGWFHLIDKLCRYIQLHVDRLKMPQVEATQVKEKFGELRFYTNHGDDAIFNAIDYTTYLSGHTCETCGTMDDVGQTTGWIITLCRKCAAAEGDQRKSWKSWDEMDKKTEESVLDD